MTWPPDSEDVTVSLMKASGRSACLRLRRWRDCLMRGTRQYPMHRFPFDLVQVQALNEEQHPMGAPMW